MNPTPVDITWVLLCSALVFLMQMGFLCLESGLTRNKNNINLAAKNLTDFAISLVLYWAVGFGLMFGVSQSGWIGTSDYFLPFRDVGMWRAAFFVFQAAFCGVAATILSGAVAERMRFRAYMLIAVVVSGVVYPVSGHWAWNGFGIGEANGWLAGLGFVDFAGSTVVHSVGGWVALATLLIIGARTGKYDERGRPRKIPASNLPIATLGVLILWIGWIGFNGGSMLALNDAVPPLVANTMLAGAMGLLGAIFVGWRNSEHVEIHYAMNGCLAGLVAITAGCHAVSALSAAVIGAVAGLVMVGATHLLDRFQIDDAVGAIPVHLAAGIWGTLAVGIFGNPELLATGLLRLQQIQAQIIGIVVVGFWAFVVSFLVLKTINRFMVLRVTPEEEEIGLNVVEHGERTDLIDLFETMDRQTRSGDLSIRAHTEPFTEVGRIANRYNQVMGSLQVTVDNLTETNMELEKANEVIRGHSDRMEQELNLGREIQMSMVPLMFPPFPEHDEFSIYAKLNPAREVGGDFYDFYFLDERRLLVCIADVSDKGVPAALFMAVAKTVIKSQAASEQSVANILTQVNAELSQSNSSCMFVTIFIGILDIQTGELVYSNGGHNPPLLRREDASIERLSKVHGPVVGAREGLVYGESRLRMRPNDLLLLYTDGVIEATNAQGDFFSEHRLEKVLSDSNSNMCRASVDLVTARVEQFEKEVEQSDDITVLALRFVGADSDGKAAPEVFRIRGNVDDMSIADDKLDAVAERHRIPADIVSKFKIILDELLSNIISYAHADDKDHEIELWMEVANSRFLLAITDDGIPFNPLTAETPDTNTPIEERELGGLGIHLARTLADEATYQRQADKNVLTLVKQFGPSGVTSDG